MAVPFVPASESPQGERAANSRELSRAKTFLKQALAAGPRRASEVKREAGEAGIPGWALTDAMQKLAESRRQGGVGSKGYWEWMLKPRKKSRKPVAV